MAYQIVLTKPDRLTLETERTYFAARRESWLGEA